MKKMINNISRKFLLIAASLMLFTGCDEIGKIIDDIIFQDVFTEQQTDVGMYTEDKEAYVYSESKHQTSRYVDSDGKNYSYRLQTDDLSEWMKVDIVEGLPTTVGETATVVVSGKNVLALGDGKSYEMAVVKSTSSKVWLWDSSSDSGVIVGR